MPSAQDQFGRETAAAVSTYLQKAKFDLQLNPMRDEHRQGGPWEQIPVVQAESEDETIAEQMEKWDP